MRDADPLITPPPGLAARRRPDAGSAAVELVLMAPILVALALLIVAAGQIVQGRIDTDGAAHAAARAASLEHTMGAASAAAEAAAEVSMGDRCGEASVSLAGDLEPGGTVTATLSCTITVDSPIWSSYEVTSIASSPVDAWRGEP
ncbi:TadE family protein [Glycomyces sp. NPDC047010]|uniref:TadE family protein n=1 Tax=Glycomyces sp. NPDC047010 TaxID=3155023 RepID=UPI00340A3CE3